MSARPAILVPWLCAVLETQAIAPPTTKITADTNRRALIWSPNIKIKRPHLPSAAMLDCAKHVEQTISSDISDNVVGHHSRIKLGVNITRSIVANHHAAPRRNPQMLATLHALLAAIHSIRCSFSFSPILKKPKDPYRLIAILLFLYTESETEALARLASSII